MKVIKENTNTLYEIRNSKFYSFLFHVENIKEVDNILSTLRVEYPNATHYCYAYIIDDIHYKNDDGEPAGTAGMPILNVLQMNELNYTLAVVIRYYGGIKLGAGGLVRAYTKSVTALLEETTLVKLKESYIIKITTDFKNLDTLKYILKDDIYDIKYEDKVYIYANIFKSDLDKVSSYNPLIIKDHSKKKD